VKPQWVRCKLGKTIEQPCSDVLAHTSEVCKGTRMYNRYPTIKDDRDSWEMCTTSVEHKNCYNSRAHGHEWQGPSHDLWNPGWVGGVRPG
jgi:hypothetical protein